MYVLKQVTCETVTRYYLVPDTAWDGWDISSEDEAWNEFHSLNTIDHDDMEVDVDTEEEIDFSQSQAVSITSEMREICKEKGYSLAFETQRGETEEQLIQLSLWPKSKAWNEEN